MKIKNVSKLTGLSDRTIRFYIEQDLISPSFKENYRGRRSYDFSDADVELLKNISILRRFGFTIVEIKLLSIDSFNSPKILSSIYERKRYQRDMDIDLLNSLERLNDKSEYTLAEIAMKLKEPSRLLKPAEEEETETKLRNFVSWIVAICLALIISVIPVYFNVSSGLRILLLGGNWKVQNFKPILIVLYIIGAFVLTFVLILLSKKTPSFLLKCIMLSIVSFCLIQSSWYFTQIEAYYCFYTDDINNYLAYTDNEYVYTIHNWIIEKTFPLHPLDMDENAKYSHYYCNPSQLDQCIDIYLELTLDENELDAEKERVVSYYELHHMFSRPTKYVVYEKNGYVCHVYLFNSKDDYWLYDKESNQYMDVSDKLNIFVADGNQNFGYTGYYDCVMFAYNENTGKVRYSYCEGFEYHPLYELDKAPYYTQVEW